MTEQEIDELFALGHETQRVEFKPAGPRTDHLLRARVVRAAMAMANRRNGGQIIVGSEDHGQNIVPVGLNDDQLMTWTNDHVSDLFSCYADPSIQFQLESIEHRGMNIVVIHVDEFDKIPVHVRGLIRLTGVSYSKRALATFAVYVRSRGKPESAEVSTHEDMRALLDLATDKAMAKWVMSNVKAGLLLRGELRIGSDDDNFETQLRGDNL
jgi:predicted HTH transcriptional regulator